MLERGIASDQEADPADTDRGVINVGKSSGDKVLGSGLCLRFAKRGVNDRTFVPTEGERGPDIVNIPRQLEPNKDRDCGCSNS